MEHRTVIVALWGLLSCVWHSTSAADDALRAPPDPEISRCEDTYPYDPNHAYKENWGRNEYIVWLSLCLGHRIIDMRVPGQLLRAHELEQAELFEGRAVDGAPPCLPNEQLENRTIHWSLLSAAIRQLRPDSHLTIRCAYFPWMFFWELDQPELALSIQGSRIGGIRATGSRFSDLTFESVEVEDYVDFDRADLQSFRLIDSRAPNVYLEGARVATDVTLSGSYSNVIASESRIDGSLLIDSSDSTGFVADRARVAESAQLIGSYSYVNLGDFQVGENLLLTKLNVDTLNLSSIEVGMSTLLFEVSTSCVVSAVAASVQDAFSVQNSHLSGGLIGDHLTATTMNVGQSTLETNSPNALPTVCAEFISAAPNFFSPKEALRLRNLSTHKLTIANSRLGAGLSVSDATISTLLSLEDDSSVLGDVTLTDTKAGSVQIVDTQLHRLAANSVTVDSFKLERFSARSIDLSGADIGGTLELTMDAEASTPWQEFSHPEEYPRLRLRNATAQRFVATSNSFLGGESTTIVPIDLIGFRFEHLGYELLTSVGTAFSAQRNWLDRWLSAQTDYSPQPYTVLAAALDRQGERRLARSVLFERAEAERHAEGTGFARRTGLLFSLMLTGHGSAPERTVLLFLLLLAVAWWICEQAPDRAMLGADASERLVFCLSNAIPFISLVRDPHAYTDLCIASANYRRILQVCRVLGYFLATYLVAIALDGLRLSH